MRSAGRPVFPCSGTEVVYNVLPILFGEAGCMSPVQVTRLLWGKVRRFAHKLRVEEVRRKHSLRRGECLRCGACCKLLFHCPSLDFDEEGKALCRKYDRRPFNCRVFPLDERCLRERDIVSPDTRCGYWFADE